MTVLSADYNAKRKDGQFVEYKVVGSDTIYKDSLVCNDTDGYLNPGSDTADVMFAGVALEQGDNSSGSDGAVSIRVQKTGSFEFAMSSASQSDVGSAAYILDDQTVGSTSTNGIQCGYIEEIVSSSKVRVRIDASVR